MTDFIVAVIILVILGAALTYIIREKKRGTKCIGCPSGGNCSGQAEGRSCQCNANK